MTTAVHNTPRCIGSGLLTSFTSVARRCAQQLAASLADRPAVQPAAAAHEPDAAVEHGDARADAHGVPAL